MTQRAWLVILGASWCALALPGCANPGCYQGQDRSTAKPAAFQKPPAQFIANQELADPPLTPPRRPDEGPSALATALQRPDVQPGMRVPERQDPPPALLPQPATEASQVTNPGPPLSSPVVGDADPPPGRVIAALSDKEDPLISALRLLLNDRPQEALKHLEGYDGTKQEMCMRLLGALATVGSKGVNQLSAEEKNALEQQLESLAATLRNPKELAITKVCFCEKIGGYKDYTPVRPGHAFKANPLGHYGERVQIYLEVSNIPCEPRDNAFANALNTTITILDSQGNLAFHYNFRGQHPPLTLQEEPCPDWFRMYYFSVPDGMQPGRYTLTVEVTDELREPHQKASKSVEFVVAN
jgi:hypothetical protein